MSAKKAAARRIPPSHAPDLPTPAERAPQVRIIGGNLRGRKLHFSGDPRTRPMKDRIREAVFNLVGPQVQGMHAVDLFAGTGALGLEAISRGAEAATFLERHFPTAELIRQSMEELGVQDQCRLVRADTLTWARREMPPDTARWLVFCSPPYESYVVQREAMRSLIGLFWQAAPVGSLLVVEADNRFDLADLPQAETWETRHYPPAVVAIGKPPGNRPVAELPGPGGQIG